MDAVFSTQPRAKTESQGICTLPYENELSNEQGRNEQIVYPFCPNTGTK